MISEELISSLLINVGFFGAVGFLAYGFLRREDVSRIRKKHTVIWAFVGICVALGLVFFAGIDYRIFQSIVFLLIAVYSFRDFRQNKAISRQKKRKTMWITAGSFLVFQVLIFWLAINYL